jgi:hypothetical protein
MQPAEGMAMELESFCSGHVGRTLRAAVAVLLSSAALAGAQSGDLPLDAELRDGATAGCAESVRAPAATSRPLPGATKILPPERGVAIGTYQIPVTAADVGRFDAAFGRMPAMVFSFHDFLDVTNGSRTPDRTFLDPLEGEGATAPPMVTAEWLNARGSALGLSWAIYCCDITSTLFWLRLKRPYNHINDVLDGVHDGFIRESARQIKASGAPIMLALMGEFNWQGQFLFGADGRTWMDAADNICDKYGDPAWPDGPERIRDMHRHVIDIFREEGVTNVTWMMYAANQYMQPGVEGQSRWLHPQYFYPGDDYIDWIGQSVYFTRADWAAEFDDTGTFQEVFLPGYAAWRSVTDKPMILPEFGILAAPEADRSELWTGLFGTWLKDVPGVKAVTIADSLLWELYFDIPQLSTNAREVGVVTPFLTADPYFTQELGIGSP